MPIDLRKGSATSSWGDEVKLEWDLVLNHPDQNDEGTAKYIDCGVTLLLLSMIRVSFDYMD